MMNIKRLGTISFAVMMAMALTACTSKEPVDIDSPYAGSGIEDASIENSNDIPEKTDEIVDDLIEEDWNFENERPADIAPDQTVAAKVTARFEAEASEAEDLMALAEAIKADENALEIAVDLVEMAPGFLNGFNGEITRFTKCVSIAPFISSMPYVSYVFESDEPDALVTELTEKADLRWNICTMADEIKTSVVGNRVFVVMAPWTF